MKASTNWEGMDLGKIKLPGLGPKSRERLFQAGIENAIDLLSFLPRDYLDYSQRTEIGSAPVEEPIHIRGRLLSKRVSVTAHRRIPVLEVLVDDGTGTLRILWYQQAYLNDKLVKGSEYSFLGKIKSEPLGHTMTNPRLVGGDASETGIQPVYSQIAGIRPHQMGAWIFRLILQMPEEDDLDSSLCSRLALPPRRTAFLTLHRPADAATVEAIRNREAPALRRLIFEEFYEFQKKLQGVIRLSQRRDHPRIAVSGPWLDRFYGVLPFKPTADQFSVIRQLIDDLAQGRRLHALVQGDVGCGKTMVGWALAHVFFRAGFQSALLCPTAVLAQQHLTNARDLLGPLGMRVALLTAQTTPKAEGPLAQVAAGEADLVIGTHKLFQKDVAFRKLGLAMIDEQHRFGVDQRSAFLKKGEAPHYIAFSATPIPRSLAMTLYGDYRVLQIVEKPADRAAIRTILKKAENRHEIVQFAKTRLNRGESVFWVFPLIEENEGQQERSAMAMYEAFRTEQFADYRVGLVHGKMDRSLINEEMARFRGGRTQILVATTVIEVGVDIPAASIMVVEGANQFGLSQLHQLRGRVGRGDREAFCFFVLQEPLTRETMARMRLLERSDNGFEIAAFDLKMRGAGQLLGKKQSGLPGFRFGDPWQDRAIMKQARDAATASPSEHKPNPSKSLG